MAKLIVPFTPLPGATTVTFTTSQTWTSPVGVTNLLMLAGKGQDGSPAVAAGYGPSVNRTAIMDDISGFSGTNPYTTGSNPVGTSSWAAYANDAAAAASTLDNGGSGFLQKMTVLQYDDSWHFFYTDITYTNSIPGTTNTTVSTGWHNSGPVLPGQAGTSTVGWRERGAYNPGSSATTGSPTTGFTLTFPGGFHEPASTASYTNVAITASTGYPLVVPSGGFITITY